MKDSSRPRVAIVGCGSIGRMHLAAFKDLGATVVGVSSRRADHAAQVAAEAGCAHTTDPFELMRRPDVDLVSVTTSSGSHAALALCAIEAGKHVVVEKPLAMSPAEAGRVVDAARASRVTLSVISQRRFEPQHQVLRGALDAGALGRVLLVEASCQYHRTQEYYDSADWRGTVAEDGGALMNQAIHSVDLVLWLGGRATQVYGRTATQTHRMEAEDMALAIVSFASGALGTIMASTSIRPGFQPALAVYGELGTVKLEGARVVHWSVPGVPAPAGGEASIAVQGPALASHDHHRAQLADVVDAIATGREPAVTGQDGLRAVELVSGVYQASATGRPVTLVG